MPTPSPINDASWVAKSGVSTRWLIRVMKPIAQPSAEQRRDERKAGRHERAEGEQEDDRGRDHAERLRRAPALAEAHHLRSRAAVLDLDGRAACGEGGVLYVLQVVGLDVVRALLVVQRGDADAPVLRQPAAFRKRARDAGHVLLRAHLLERARDPESVGGVRERAGASLVDDLVGVALGCRKVLGEQVVCTLALGAGQPEARDLLDADARGDPLDHDQRQQPGAERAPAMAVAEPCEAHETRGGKRGGRHLGRQGSHRWIRWPPSPAGEPGRAPRAPPA